MCSDHVGIVALIVSATCITVLHFVIVILVFVVRLAAVQLIGKHAGVPFRNYLYLITMVAAPYARPTTTTTTSSSWIAAVRYQIVEKFAWYG